MKSKINNKIPTIKNKINVIWKNYANYKIDKNKP
jgi:hypothetical protein